MDRVRDASGWSYDPECDAGEVLERARGAAIEGAATGYAVGFFGGFAAGAPAGAVAGATALAWLPGGILLGGATGFVLAGASVGHQFGKGGAATGFLLGAGFSLLFSATRCMLLLP